MVRKTSFPSQKKKRVTPDRMIITPRTGIIATEDRSPLWRAHWVDTDLFLAEPTRNRLMIP